MENAIVVFSRAPIAGKTKTRLMPFLTGEECAAVHSAFIKDTYRVCMKTGADILVFYTPDDQGLILKKLFTQVLHSLGRPAPEDTGGCRMCGAVHFLPQNGENIGERMEKAFGIAFRLGYKKVLLIGTDIPQVTPAILEHAYESLDENEVVIHPTVDGGYYLIGMTKEHEDIWDLQQYGTNTVLHNTLVRLKRAGLMTAVGPVCRDIDTPEDLCALYRELWQENPEDISCTAEYMRGRIKEKLRQGAADRKGRYGQFKR